MVFSKLQIPLSLVCSMLVLTTSLSLAQLYKETNLFNMADIEILTARFAKLALEPAEHSTAMKSMVETITAQLAKLMLHPPEPPKPVKKMRFTLKAKVNAVIDRFIKLLPVTCHQPSFPQPPKVCGVKRRLDESLNQQQEPQRKRPRNEIPTHFDLDAFERAQMISWETYQPTYAGRKYQTAFNIDFPSIRIPNRRVERVTKVLTQDRIIHLRRRLQITAYQQLLREAGTSSIPHYHALFTRNLDSLREEIAEESNAYRTQRKKMTKAQHALRCWNSLKEKGARFIPAMAIYWANRVNTQEKKIARRFRRVARLRRTERGMLGLVCNYLAYFLFSPFP